MILNDVEAIHRRALLVGAAALEETVGEADTFVALVEKLAVQGHNHIGLLKIRQQTDTLPERGRNRPLCQSGSERLTCTKSFPEIFPRVPRGACLAWESFCAPPEMPYPRQTCSDLEQIVQCFRASLDAVFLYRLGTIRIVEIQDARLSESVCSAIAERMKGLPSIFVGRPSTVLTIRGIAPCRNGIAVA